jgi:hypothetical protein
MPAMACQAIARDAWAVGNGATRATVPAGMRRTSAPVKNGGGASGSAHSGTRGRSATSAAPTTTMASSRPPVAQRLAWSTKMASSRPKNRLAMSMKRVGTALSTRGSERIAAHGSGTSRMRPPTCRRSPIDSTSMTMPVTKATRTTPLRHHRATVNASSPTSGMPR